MFCATARSARILIVTTLAAAVLLGVPASAQTVPSLPAVNRLTTAVEESSLVALRGTVSPRVKAAQDQGVAPDSMPLSRLHLVLKRSAAQETALRQLISEMHTPGSASYHQWLTPEQFGAQFGPSDQDIATLIAWLVSHGFQVGEVKPGKQVLEFSGSVAQMREAFHTSIHSYVLNGESHYANATDPQIPAALAPVLGGFVSLNNFRIKPYRRYLGTAIYDTKTHTAQPQWTYGTNNKFTFPLAPADFAVQYDLNPLYGTAVNGAGQTIAVINDANINGALVNQFRSLFGLSANPPQVILDGNDPGIDGVNNPDGPNGDSVEAYLDVEWSGAVAPAATIDMVIAADTALESGLILAAEHAVYGNIAPVMSLSFGNCEADMGSGNGFLNSLWEQAAAQGITVLAATGDNGSAGCDDPNTQYYAVNGLAVSGFASTPYNVAVGGTDFYYSDYNSSIALDTQIPFYWSTTATQLPAASLLQVIPEQPWNDSQYGLNIGNFYSEVGNLAATTIGAGSGGASGSAICSTSYNSNGNCTGTLSGYPKPAWQSGSGVPADHVRDLPDLSLFAADGANYSYFPVCAASGDCQQPSGSNLVQITGIGGTSVSVQTFAGMMALVNQKYGRQGQANFVLYPLKAQYPAAFHDITHGTNSVPCAYLPLPSSPDCIGVANPLTVTDPTNGAATEGQMGIGSSADYNASAGYNLATGLGSVDANLLVSDWNKISLATTATTLTPSSTGFTHGASITISGSVTGGSGTPSGEVALMTDSITPLNQGEAFFTLSNGTFSDASVNYLPGGSYNIWGRYGGSGSNLASSSTKTQITVSPEASSVEFDIYDVATGATNTVPGISAALPYGTQLIPDAQPVPTSYYTQCVIAAHPPASCSTTSFTYPTGTVTFADNGSTINVAEVNAEGDAEYNAPWSVGSHSVTAKYSGDASYNASTTSAIGFSVVPDTPSISISSAGGQSTVVTVLVENSANLSNEITYDIGYSNPAAAPTGSVTIQGFPSGVPTSAALSAATDSTTFSPEGVATIGTSATIPAGTYYVTISYPGDMNYNAVSRSLVVNIGSPGFTLSSGGSSTITEGSSGSNAITVSPSGGFTGNVALSCKVSGSSAGVGCSVSPATVSITGTAAASTTLTITTTSTSGAFYPKLKNLFPLGGGLSLAMVMLFGVPVGRRSWRSLLGLFVVLTVCLAGIGCGGSSSSSSSSSGSGGSASYFITVTGVSGSYSATTQVAVTVKQ
jgi:hypothetical protein